MNDTAIIILFSLFVLGIVIGQISYWYFYKKCPEEHKEEFVSYKNGMYMFTIFARSMFGLLMLLIAYVEFIPKIVDLIVAIPTKIMKFIDKVMFRC